MLMVWNYIVLMVICVQCNVIYRVIKFWLLTDQLSLNVGKSHVMLIGSQQKLRDSDLYVSINGRRLSRVPSLKYLGVLIDEHLT